MDSKEINITYETLFEILKREKETTDLQKLDYNFLNDFADYLNEKRKLLEKEDALFSYEEKKKLEKQIDNARRLIKEIYEKREKKIIELALIKSRTKSNIIDKSHLLDNEKEFFNEIVKVLDSFRAITIDNVLTGSYLQKNSEKDAFSDADAINEKKPKKDTKIVRFLYSVPKFVGKELEEYGPFGEEDIANLPNEIAELLIEKGRVEEIKED